MKELILGESLDELIDYRGRTPKKMGANYTAQGVPVASALSVDNGVLNLARARFVSEETYRKWMSVPIQKGDVLLTSEAPLGRVAIVPTDAPLVLGQRLFALRGKNGVLDNEFLFYALQTESVRADIIGRSTGTTVVGIRQSALRHVRITAPSFEEQQAIAEVLGALDDKIAANTNMAATLAELASTYFDYALSGSSQPTPLRELVTTQYGLTISAHSEPGPKFLRVTDINKRAWIEWDRTPNCTVTESELQKYRVEAGDILVARMADPGKAAYIDGGDPPAVFASYLVRLKAVDPVHSLIVYYNLRSKEYQQYAEGATQGSVQRNMNAQVIINTDIGMPEHSEILRFNDLVTPLRMKIQSSLNENRTLAELRDTLLPQLMSGKLRVKDAETAVEEVL
jgi:type I restriction enzyme S subunit